MSLTNFTSTYMATLGRWESGSFLCHTHKSQSVSITSLQGTVFFCWTSKGESEKRFKIVYGSNFDRRMVVEFRGQFQKLWKWHRIKTIAAQLACEFDGGSTYKITWFPISIYCHLFYKYLKCLLNGLYFKYTHIRELIYSQTYKRANIRCKIVYIQF